MTISSLTSSSAASQLSYVSKTGSANANDSGESGQVGNGPPPPQSGGGFINAIASVLESLGLSEGDSATGDSTSSDGSTGSGNAAQALGSFLHELMGALHEQGASPESSSPGDGQAYGPPGGNGGPGGPGGPGGAGGSGKLEADLQSLISKLGSSSETAGSDGTEDSGSALESSFQSLLEALGSDTSNSGGKLASFLQALSDKLPNAGTSGNLINTSA